MMSSLARSRASTAFRLRRVGGRSVSLAMDVHGADSWSALSRTLNCVDPQTILANRGAGQESASLFPQNEDVVSFAIRREDDEEDGEKTKWKLQNKYAIDKEFAHGTEASDGLSYRSADPSWENVQTANPTGATLDPSAFRFRPASSGYGTPAFGNLSGFDFDLDVGTGPQTLGPIREQRARIHSTPSPERAAAIMLTLASVSAGAFAASSAVKSYNDWKASQPSIEEQEEAKKREKQEQEQKNSANANANIKDDAKADSQAKSSTNSKTSSNEERENIFKKWFGVGVGVKYYEGGFEETMTRREAALILGVRESSPPDRIKAAHRKLLVLNHPDAGGSTYMAGKINEAKELLLKGRRGV